jgi:hypothetical protein
MHHLVLPGLMHCVLSVTGFSLAFFPLKCIKFEILVMVAGITMTHRREPYIPWWTTLLSRILQTAE